MNTKLDTTSIPIDTYINRTIHDGILNVYQLLNEKKPVPWLSGESKLKRDDYIEKNLNKIIETIKKYPITYAEAIWDCIESDNLGALSHYREGMYKKVIDSILPPKTNEKIKVAFNNYFGSNYKPSEVEGNVPERYLSPMWYAIIYKTFDERVAVFKRAKEKIIGDLKLTYTMYKKTDSLNTNHFKELLEQGDYKNLILDLCIRMEERFKGEHKYTGTLMQMLELYLNDIRKNRQEYDNSERMWNNLSKLIRCRNNIVHKNDSNETMSYKELQNCIEYVSKI